MLGNHPGPFLFQLDQAVPGPPDIDFIVRKTTEGTDDKTQEKINRVLRELNASTMDDVGP